jgi:DNA-binding PucR family transcriptional regulator
MINKILAYYPNSVTQEFPPGVTLSGYYWFKENQNQSLWFGIPKDDLPDSQLELMKILFHYVDPKQTTELSGAAKSWYQFLLHGGEVPPAGCDEVRFIQFQLHSAEMDRNEVNEALQGFFPDYIIFWLQETYGLLIEENKEVSITSEELESVSSTFESDFFTRLSFYIGKYQKISSELPVFFQTENQLFLQAVNLAGRLKVYTFEQIFPIIITAGMNENLKQILEASVLEAFDEDREVMATIKVFLENNSNASLAAKKLYVHRNTLQYRLDKFMEKTGINLKNFDSAVMVYLACLYEEMN